MQAAACPPPGVSSSARESSQWEANGQREQVSGTSAVGPRQGRRVGPVWQ